MRWENTGTVAVMVILVFVVMVAITVPFLICDIKRIKAESAEEELADDSANECADDQESKQQTGVNIHPRLRKLFQNLFCSGRKSFP